MANVIGDTLLVPCLRCTQECAHCCRTSGPHRREVMSDAVFEHLPKWISPYVIISGGEPLMFSRALWAKIIKALRCADQGVEHISIITNGDFLLNARSLYRALTALAELTDLAEVCVALSGDQFHNTQPRAQKMFKHVFTAPWDYFELPRDCEDWPYIGKIETSLRNLRIDQLTPRGRARRLVREGCYPVRSADCDVDDDDCNVSVSVHWDGTLRACCGNGPVIGNVSEPVYRVLDRQMRLSKRLKAKYSGKWGCISGEACFHCDAIARQLMEDQ